LTVFTLLNESGLTMHDSSMHGIIKMVPRYNTFLSLKTGLLCWRTQHHMEREQY